jgi:hypothetical protein
MARFVLRGVISRKSLIGAACLLASSCVHAPLALAQHPGHVATGGHVSAPIHAAAPHIVAPPVIHAPISRPPISVQRSPIPIFRQPIFIRAPFFRFRPRFISSWWLACGPYWGWEFGCNDFSYYAYPIAPENYSPPLIYENPPSVVYVYGGGDRDLVHLYLQDGTVIGVTDYWFVNDQIHFTVQDDASAKGVEQVIALDELDLQKTIDVNTRRGFRLVKRSEPMEQYLRDYPNLDPPLLQPPPKNELPQKN